MIPDIGLVVCCYVVVQMFSILSRTGEKAEHTLVQIFAGLALVVTLVCAVDLVYKGTGVTNLLYERKTHTMTLVSNCLPE